MNLDDLEKLEIPLNEEQETGPKEVYAHFGLAYFLSNCLEQTITNCLFVIEYEKNKKSIKTEEQYNHFYEITFKKSFDSTLGNLIKSFDNHFSDDPLYLKNKDKLKNVKKDRDFLAHHFFRENSDEFISEVGRRKMILWLIEIRNQTDKIDKIFIELMNKLSLKLGITDEIVEVELKKRNELAENLDNDYMASKFLFDKLAKRVLNENAH